MTENIINNNYDKNNNKNNSYTDYDCDHEILKSRLIVYHNLSKNNIKFSTKYCPSQTRTRDNQGFIALS